MKREIKENETKPVSTLTDKESAEFRRAFFETFFHGKKKCKLCGSKLDRKVNKSAVWDMVLIETHLCKALRGKLEIKTSLHTEIPFDPRGGMNERTVA